MVVLVPALDLSANEMCAYKICCVGKIDVLNEERTVKAKNKLDDEKENTPVVVRGQYFVKRERWVHDGTWHMVVFAEKKSWANADDATIGFRDKVKAEKMAARLNKIIGW